MDKKKILICGATGFIGRNLAEYYANNTDYEVFGTYFKSRPFRNQKIKFIKADLRDPKDVIRAIKGKDIIVQAAATTSGVKDIVTKPYIHVTDNALMNSLIFRAAHEYKISRVVFFSCTVMYQPNQQAVKEADFNANDPIYDKYFGVGWTKVYIEKMCEFYSRIGSTIYTAIRHSNIYGPFDKYDLEKSHVFGATLTKIMSAQDNSQITVWGTGEEERDLLHVSDLVKFVDSAIDRQKDKFKLYNVGLGSAISVRDLVEKIIAHSGKSLSIFFDTTKPTIKTKLFLDCSKAKNELNWSPVLSLDQGIKETIYWYRGYFKIKEK